MWTLGISMDAQSSLSRHHWYHCWWSQGYVCHESSLCVCVSFCWRSVSIERIEGQVGDFLMFVWFVFCLRSEKAFFQLTPGTRQCPRQLQKLPLFIIVQDRGWNMDRETQKMMGNDGKILPNQKPFRNKELPKAQGFPERKKGPLTVVGRNPKQPPGIYKTLQIMG